MMDENAMNRFLFCFVSLKFQLVVLLVISTVCCHACAFKDDVTVRLTMPLFFFSERKGRGDAELHDDEKKLLYDTIQTVLYCTRIHMMLCH
jgi:hypothetical protein